MVLLDKQDYIVEMNRLLSDMNTYIPLNKDTNLCYKKRLIELIRYSCESKILNKKEKEYLIPSSPRIPIIYYLPKIHMECYGGTHYTEQINMTFFFPLVSF